MAELLKAFAATCRRLEKENSRYLFDAEIKLPTAQYQKYAAALPPAAYKTAAISGFLSNRIFNPGW